MWLKKKDRLKIMIMVEKKSWNWIEQANSDPWIQTMTKSENGIHKNAFKIFLVTWKHTMVCEILVSM